MTDDGRREIERVARTSYGRLVALLAYRWRDVADAEDALGDAVASALLHWPRTGVPRSPEAWLMTAAKRTLLQRVRHAKVIDDPAVAALLAFDEQAPDLPAIPDERLRLMFVCTHPALPEPIRAPLMLQVVLGLEAATIAQAFVVSPRAMAQRLVRAKVRIRDTGMRFEEPEAAELPERLDAVLDSIYAAYTIGRHRSASDAAPLDAGLTDEAVWLGRVVVTLLPQEPEPLGLLALMLYCEARRPAQFDGDVFVPLVDQDPARWDRERLVEAERCLIGAARLARPGPFQIEAAIQSAHCERAFTGRTPWPAIAALYASLVELHRGTGARVGHAVALAEAGDAAGGLAILDALAPTTVASYQPYWVARARLLRLQGRAADARAATDHAIGLTEDVRVRTFLAGQRM